MYGKIRDGLHEKILFWGAMPDFGDTMPGLVTIRALPATSLQSALREMTDWKPPLDPEAAAAYEVSTDRVRMFRLHGSMMNGDPLPDETPNAKSLITNDLPDIVINDRESVTSADDQTPVPHNHCKICRKQYSERSEILPPGASRDEIAQARWHRIPIPLVN